MKIVQKPTIEGLPPKHEVICAGKIEEEKFFVVHCPEGGDYNDYQVSIGPANDLKEVVVNKVTVYRDGGSTLITVVEGIFYFPYPCKEGLFNNQKIEIFADLCKLRK